MSANNRQLSKQGTSITELLQQPVPHPFIAEMIEELCVAQDKHGPMRSAHEAYSVILEEVDEFWQEVKRKREERDLEAMRRELMQIAAMACRAAIDLHL